MAILDLLTGQKQIDRQEKIANQVAAQRYDPTIYNPQLEESRRVASEGINDAEIRTDVLNRLYANENLTQASYAGGNQGLALAQNEATDQMRSQTLAEQEGQISLQEEQAKDEARGRVASLMSKVRSVQSQRDAQIQQNRLTAEAEASRRKRSLGAAALKFGLQAAGTAIGGRAGGSIGSIVGSKIGGAIKGGGGREQMSEVAALATGQEGATPTQAQRLPDSSNIMDDVMTTPELSEGAQNVASATEEGRASMQLQAEADYFGVPVGQYKQLKNSGLF